MENKEKNHIKGQLTIFLGAFSGVGKTYALLEAAHEKYLQGYDIVVGWVDTHKRPEPEYFLKKLPVIHPQAKVLAGKVYFDIDKEAIIKRRPKIVVIDNLSWSKSAGCEHTKRYQDVEDLLRHGIDVYTTLNIQHVESLKDIVEGITGIKVIDTVPDRLLENADIKLIDVSSDETTQRLHEGKVYLPSEINQTPDKFYRAGNINALRELALRYTARRVDRQLNEYMQVHEIKGPWPAAERILACVSISPFSAQQRKTRFAASCERRNHANESPGG